MKAKKMPTFIVEKQKEPMKGYKEGEYIANLQVVGEVEAPSGLHAIRLAKSQGLTLSPIVHRKLVFATPKPRQRKESS